LKLYEGFAAGKAIVATPIHALQRHEGLVYISATVEETTQRLHEALQHPAARRDGGIALARENDWEQRVEQIAHLIAGVLEKRRRASPAKS
jgi:hypothetical protein